MRTKKCCSKGFLFKIYLSILGITDLVYGLISCLNCISEWSKTGLRDYIKLPVNSVLIANITFNVVVHIGTILVLIILSRNTLFLYLFGLGITTCLSFAAIWICFIDRLSILDNLNKFYSSFYSAVELNKFENRYKCCGWEFISSRCTNISGISCITTIEGILDSTGNLTGNTLIPLVFIELAEVMYVIFILVCYSGIDWRDIKPFIRPQN